MRKRSYFVKKNFVLVPGLECSFKKSCIWITEIPVAKTEISVTGLLVWTHRDFYVGKIGKAISRKPSQPGWPGSHEEALKGNEKGR